MRTAITYVGTLCLVLGGLVALISATPAPERLIRGSWQETNWSYEVVDLSEGDDEADFLKQVKRSVGRGLVLHQAETWDFFPDHRLRLTGGGQTTEARWYIKGRGNILRIVHPGGDTENYEIDRLDRGTLRLQFETDIQARGIASLEFNRNSASTHRHAQEIQ